MEQDSLQDNLEIHFQKTANGGGEVESIVYNPMGNATLAVFVEDSPEDSQNVWDIIELLYINNFVM